MRYTFAFLLVFLVACAPEGISEDQHRKNAWVVACEGYANALATLATARRQGQLSQDIIDRVDVWRERINPICQADAPPEREQTMHLLDQAVYELVSIAKNLEGT